MSVSRQKAESQSGCFKKTKQFKSSEKRTFLTLLICTRTYVCASGGNKCSFFENLACFVFLKHRFWDSPFCLVTDEITALKSFIDSNIRHQDKFQFFTWNNFSSEVRGHSLSTYAKFSEKLTFLTPWYVHP